MTELVKFKPDQIDTVNNAVEMAEELVSNHYKMSATQWLRRRYDVKTLEDLSPDEIVHGPFAQIIRYEGQLKNVSLGSSTYDLYRICLQDHSIYSALVQTPEMDLFPFTLYIMTHELIHIVRFSKFQQHFEASSQEIKSEENRVHEKTHKILNNIRVAGLSIVFRFYQKWGIPYESLESKKDG